MIISISSQKGGVGKTTTSISLSAGLAKDGKKILLIDIDPQANSSKVLCPGYERLDKDSTVYSTIINRGPLTIHQSTIGNLSIVPSHILLSDADVELTTAKDHREERLKVALSAIESDFDYIFIDCPPSLGWLTINALTASNAVLAVVSPGYFELDSTEQLGKTIQEVRSLFNPSLDFLGFVFVMADPTINSQTSLKILRQTYTNKVMKSIIPRNTDIRDALYNKKDIFTYKPDAKSAIAYRSLIKELFYHE